VPLEVIEMAKRAPTAKVVERPTEPKPKEKPVKRKE
jgi:hypothetical protein